jgi:hypothetical protein
MIFILDDEQRADLKLLESLAAEYIDEFCRLGVEFVRAGEKEKIYTKAGSALGIDSAAVQKLLHAISYVFLEGGRLALTPEEFHESLKASGVAPASKQLETLTSTYTVEQEFLRSSCLTPSGNAIPQYQNLEWRLDVELSRRGNLHVCEPSFLLQLETAGEQPTNHGRHMFECDYATLHHITTQLDAALAEGNNPRSRRIQRYIR